MEDGGKGVIGAGGGGLQLAPKPKNTFAYLHISIQYIKYSLVFFFFFLKSKKYFFPPFFFLFFVFYLFLNSQVW